MNLVHKHYKTWNKKVSPLLRIFSSNLDNLPHIRRFQSVYEIRVADYELKQKGAKAKTINQARKNQTKANRVANSTQEERLKDNLTNEQHEVVGKILKAKGDEIFQLLNRASKQQHVHQAYFHQAMLQFNDLRDFRKSKKCFDMMRKYEFQPTLATYTTYFTVCSRMGEYESAVQAHEEMKRNGLKLTLVSASALLQSYASLNRLPELLESINRSGLRKDIIFYSSLLRIYGSAGDVNLALDLYEEMKSNNTAVNPVFVIEFLNVLKTHGDIALTRKYFWILDNELSSRGEQMLVEGFNQFIWALSEGGDLEEVNDLLEEMKDRKLKTDDSTRRATLQVHAVKGDVPTILKNLNTRLDCFGSLVYALQTNDRLDKLEGYVQKYFHFASTIHNSRVIFAALHEQGDFSLLDRLYNIYARKGLLSFEGWDLRQYSVGIAAACVRSGLKELKVGECVNIVTGNNNVKMRKGHEHLRDYFLNTSEFENAKISSHPRNPKMLLLERIR